MSRRRRRRRGWLERWWPAAAGITLLDVLAWAATAPPAWCTLDPAAAGCGSTVVHAALASVFVPLLGVTLYSCVLAVSGWAVRCGQARTARRRTRPPLPPGLAWWEETPQPPPDDDWSADG